MIIVPLICNNLPKAIEHARVVVLARYWHGALELSVRASVTTIVRAIEGSVSCCLHSGLDHVQRVHDQDLGDTGHGTRDELVDKGKRLGLAGHGGRVRVGGGASGRVGEGGRLTLGVCFKRCICCCLCSE